MAAADSWGLWLALGGGIALALALAARDAIASTEQQVVQLGARLGAPVNPIKVTSGFGSRIDPITGEVAGHPGLDLAASFMQPVAAAEAGIVTRAGEWYGYGNQVVIDHGDGLSTSYSHLTQIYVSVGDMVDGGQTVAGAGSTGRSTGVHLHFEVTQGGTAVDPAPYLGL